MYMKCKHKVLFRQYREMTLEEDAAFWKSHGLLNKFERMKQGVFYDPDWEREFKSLPFEDRKWSALTQEEKDEIKQEKRNIDFDCSCEA